MCGIAGFSGHKALTKEQAKIAVNKMKILGLFNQSRGTHGCGLYINGTIIKGIEDLVAKKNTKEFAKFISDPDFIWPDFDVTKGNVMILHTRMATHGAHTEANTHPFFIKSENPVNNLVGVHNGTLDNAWELLKKYDVDAVKEHIHVDSKALYTLIDRVGLNILEEYKGAAALVWSKPSDPRTLYAFHGSYYKDRKDKQLYEERPMHWMKTAEGIYFSSMPESLFAIRESDKQEVETLEYNTVFKVTNGKFTTTKVEIKRENTNLKPEYTPVPARAQVIPFNEQQTTPMSSRNARTIVEDTERTERMIRMRNATADKKDKLLNVPKSSLVWRETKPAKSVSVRLDEIVYFWKGRYHRSSGDKFCNGLLYIADRGVITTDADKVASKFYFYEGVLMKNATAWEALVQEANMKDSWVHDLSSMYAYNISRFSQHPVTHLDSECVDGEDYFRYSWYLDERRVTSKYRPLFSGRCYHIDDGFLVTIIPSNGDEKKTIEGDLDDIVTALENKFTVLPGDVCCTTPVGYTQTSVFDIVFNDVPTLFETLNYEEMEALSRFAHDKLLNENKSNDLECVQAEVHLTIKNGVASKKTIREAFNDQDHLLNGYLKVILDEKVDTVEALDVVNTTAPFNTNEDDDIDDDQVGDLTPEEQKAADDAWAKWGNFRGVGSGRPKGSEDRPGALVDAESPFPNLLDDDVETQNFHVAQFLGTNGDEEKEDHFVEHFEADMERALELKKIKQQIAFLKSDSDKVEEVIDDLGEIELKADELRLSKTDLGKDCSFHIYKGLSMLKHALSNVCEIHFQDDLVKKLNLVIRA